MRSLLAPMAILASVCTAIQPAARAAAFERAYASLASQHPSAPALVSRAAVVPYLNLLEGTSASTKHRGEDHLRGMAAAATALGGALVARRFGARPALSAVAIVSSMWQQLRLGAARMATTQQSAQEAQLAAASAAPVPTEDVAAVEAAHADVTGCYVVDGVETDGRALVVCTPEPQEYAWFHGLPAAMLRAVGGDSDLGGVGGLDECTLGWSHRGVEEWECR